MTVILGILCEDGVVMASDSAATFGDGARQTIGQQEIKKVHVIEDRILFSSTGAVGMGQLYADKIKTLCKAQAFSGTSCASPEAAMQAIGNAINLLAMPYLQSGQMLANMGGSGMSSLCKCLIAMPVKQEPCLFTFDYNGAPERATRQTPFVSYGSGQQIADPFLALLHRLLWKDKAPTVAEGRFAAVWTIEHVKQTNAGGVAGPVQLATMTAGASPVVTQVDEKLMAEHLQKVLSVEARLKDEIRGEPSATASPLPIPPGQGVAERVSLPTPGAGAASGGAVGA